jgi:3-isopropylmalate/(R)-2-methylmalate dehydratase small subunit
MFATIFSDMERFTQLTGVAAPLPQANIDTDIIFPARFLLITAKTGLGRYAFHDWRYGPGGSPRADFVLNQPRFADAPILIAGENFGCGSSREQAPWALRDLGVRCIIATSFGDIFQANCFKNGILPITLSPDHVEPLMSDAEAGLPVEVDLERQTIGRRNAPVIAFEVEAWRREALLNGWDEIAVITRQQGARIDAFEQTQRATAPWLYTGD